METHLYISVSLLLTSPNNKSSNFPKKMALKLGLSKKKKQIIRSMIEEKIIAKKTMMLLPFNPFFSFLRSKNVIFDPEHSLYGFVDCLHI